MDKIGFGQPASKGTATGKFFMSVGDVIKYSELGEKVILVKSHTTPEDSIAIRKSVGVITKVGGLVSHAAICSREYSKPCIINCLGFEIKPKGLNTENGLIKEGTMITINANTGNIYLKGGMK